jgi:hypothetical protein
MVIRLVIMPMEAHLLQLRISRKLQKSRHIGIQIRVELARIILAKVATLLTPMQPYMQFGEAPRIMP